MDAVTKHLFWIILGAVLLLGIGVYAWMGPTLQSDTAEKQQKCADKTKEFEEMYNKLKAPDYIKTPEHVRLASEFSNKVNEQLVAVHADWAGDPKAMPPRPPRRIEQNFNPAPPTDNASFDTWLNGLRQKLAAQADAPGVTLKLPDDFDVLLFKNQATDDQALDSNKHRDYRLNQVAVIQELIDIMCRKYPVRVMGFERDEKKPEPATTAQAGALAIERIKLLTPEESAERTKVWTEEVLNRSGIPKPVAPVAPAAPAAAAATGAAGTPGAAAATTKGAPPPPAIVPLPYTYSTIDVQFVAPPAVVPQIISALENSKRYSGVIERVDYQRKSPNPFPDPKDNEVKTAGPALWANTHYNEGPLRVLVTMDLYMFDKSKDKTFLDVMK